MHNAFGNKKGAIASTQLGKMIESLQEHQNAGSLTNPVLARHAISTESLDDNARHNLFTAGESLSVAIEQIATDLNMPSPTPAQTMAGTVAGVLAGDFKSVLNNKMSMPTVGNESMSVVQAQGIQDALSNRSFGLEAYDEKENRNAALYSITYNYQSARLDGFGEAFYPTITLTPDNVGFGITVNLMMVYDAVERKITGTFEDFKKKNIIRAVVDSTILRKEQTRAIPVHRAQSADKFAAGITPTALDLEGESINTAPLAFGKKVDLLGLSQTDALLAAGTADQTDSLDPTISLSTIYVDFGTDVLKFNVANLPLSNFTYSTQNNYRVETLSFTTTSVLVNKNTKAIDGSALVDLASIVTNDYIVRLNIVVSGTVNIETGETELFGNKIAVHSIQDNTGLPISMTTGAGAALVAEVASGVLVGYDLLAYRSNANRRQRGQLIDVQKWTQLYNVPLRSPITTIHPITTDGTTDASDVQALITATRIRTCNEAVTSLINTSVQLSEYIDSRDALGVGPDLMGVGRFYVRPTFKHKALDMATAIDSIKSHERAEDIQAVLVNAIRDMAYTMYRDSEYKAAADALNGGVAPVPTVVIGTDPVTARYLTVTGDLRTLGNEFDVKIEVSLDSRVKGKIFVAFSSFDENRNVAPNPLNFGNFIWAPELVLTANISRGGTISKETVVQPRYLFVNHCPVMGVIEVTNIPTVLSKVPQLFKNVP
jgi:hypothetical protein